MSKVPIVHPLSWRNVVVTLGLLVVFVAVGAAFGGVSGAFAGTLGYLAVSLFLRKAFTRHHSRGIRYCKRLEFDQAIPEFETSMQFFQEHEWVDRYRAITVFSVSEMTYREMAMVSLGFCHAQIGDGAAARGWYEQCLKEYPANVMAQSALRFFDSVGQ